MLKVEANRFHEVWEAAPLRVPPGTDALVTPAGRRITYEALLSGAARLAASLASRGLTRADRVLFLLAPGIELYQGILAVLKLGGVSVFVNPADGRDHLEHCVARARPRALVGSPRAAVLFVRSPALRAIPLKIRTPGTSVVETILHGSFDISYEACLAGQDPSFPTQAVKRSDPATLSFTTGTTGRPKGVSRSHGDLKEIYDSLCRHPRKRETGVNLVAFPNLPLDDLAAGRTSVLANVPYGRMTAVPVKPILSQIQAEEPRLISAPPGLVEAVVEESLRQGRTWPSVRHLFVGSGVASLWLFAHYRAVFPGAELSSLYGSTEAEPISHLAVPEDLQALREAHARGLGVSVGVPEGIEIAVVAPSRKPLERVVPTSGEGEILVSGPHVNRSYWDDPEETRRNKVEEPGGQVWHRTGDIGWRAPDGTLWLRGRLKDRLVLESGESLDPVTLEARVDLLDGVRRSALVPVLVGGHRGSDLAKDPPRSVLALAVEPRGPGPASEDLRGGIRDVVSPLEVEIVFTVIPMDPRSGSKIDREELAARIGPELRSRRTAPFARRLAVYLEERFPIGDHLVGAALYVVGVLGLAGQAWWRDLPGTGLTVALVLFLFFHLRLFDELKDLAVDRAIHPERAVSRGVLTVGELSFMSLVAVAAEVVLAASLGPTAFRRYLLALLYSIGMRHEFGIRTWLRQHIFFYGLTHVSLAFFLVQLILARVFPDQFHISMGLLSVSLGWFAEISRKITAPDAVLGEGELREESYTKELGFQATMALLGAILLTGAGIGIHLGSVTGRGPLYTVALLSSVGLVCVATAGFYRDPTPATAKKAHQSSLLWALVQYVLLATGPMVAG